MTLSEFKAWFAGFTEEMDGAPSEKQWKRIKAKVKDIDGVTVTKTVFVDHYAAPYRPYWQAQRFDVFGLAGNSSGGAISIGKAGGHGTVCAGKAAEFDSHNAMLDLGKAEYSAALNDA